MREYVEEATPAELALSLLGFAAFVRSNAMNKDDHEMVAKKFETAAAEITRLRDALKAADRFVADELDARFASGVMDGAFKRADDCLAVIREALGEK